MRAERPDDVPAIRAAHTGAFGRPDEAELVDALRRDPAAWDPDRSLVAEVDGDVVGHVLLTRVAVTTADGVRSPVLALAPLGVRPEFQRRGVGTALVSGALAVAGLLPVVVLGDPAYYGRFGFADATPAGIRPPFRVPPGAFQLWCPAGAPAPPPGVVRYPAAFSAVG